MGVAKVLKPLLLMSQVTSIICYKFSKKSFKKSKVLLIYSILMILLISAAKDLLTVIWVSSLRKSLVPINLVIIVQILDSAVLQKLALASNLLNSYSICLIIKNFYILEKIVPLKIKFSQKVFSFSYFIYLLFTFLIVQSNSIGMGVYKRIDIKTLFINFVNTASRILSQAIFLQFLTSLLIYLYFITELNKQVLKISFKYQIKILMTADDLLRKSKESIDNIYVFPILSFIIELAQNSIYLFMHLTNNSRKIYYFPSLLLFILLSIFRILSLSTANHFSNIEVSFVKFYIKYLKRLFCIASALQLYVIAL